MSRELIEREAKRRVGSVIAQRYALLRLIGTGGMGAVFEATDRTLDARVAVKLLLDASEDPTSARFAREARVLTQLSRDNIVRVLDYGRDEPEGTLFLVEELLLGEDLRARLRRCENLSPRECRALLLPVMDALGYAHAQGVVHRDVKPENIFLAERAEGTVPTLIDFGIARMTTGSDSFRSRSGAVLGTPVYMSPEQAFGHRSLDARSDVWAVGVVLFELLAGVAPFVGNYNEVLSALLTLDAPPLRCLSPDCPDDIAQLVSRALARDPDRRFSSMRDFALALSDCPSFASDAPLERAPASAERHFTAADSLAPSPTAPSALPAPALVAPASPTRRSVRRAVASLALASLALLSARAFLHSSAPSPAPVVALARSVPTTPRAAPVGPVVAPVVAPPPATSDAPRPVARVMRPAARPPRAAPTTGANGAPLLLPYE